MLKSPLFQVQQINPEPIHAEQYLGPGIEYLYIRCLPTLSFLKDNHMTWRPEKGWARNREDLAEDIRQAFKNDPYGSMFAQTRGKYPPSWKKMVAYGVLGLTAHPSNEGTYTLEESELNAFLDAVFDPELQGWCDNHTRTGEPLPTLILNKTNWLLISSAHERTIVSDAELNEKYRKIKQID